MPLGHIGLEQSIDDFQSSKDFFQILEIPKIRRNPRIGYKPWGTWFEHQAIIFKGGDFPRDPHSKGSPFSKKSQTK